MYDTLSRHFLASVFFLVTLVILGIIYLPSPARAFGTAADAMCLPAWDWGCPCGVVCHKGGPPGGLGCPCSDTSNGFTTQGKCTAALKCQGTSSEGQNGGMGDLKQALDMVKSILDMMKGGGGGGGGGGQPQTTPTTDPTLGGCSRYYNVTQPSSDPCAVYVPPVSDSLGSSTGSGATDLISSLLGGTNTTNTGTPAVTNPTPATTQTTQAPVTAQVTSASTGTPRVGVPAGTPATTLNPGVFGDIQYSTNEVTVLVNNVDTKSGTQVAGFYGTPAGGQPTGVIANMCQSRPWATNFLSSIIPSAFFDSLCQLRGYQTTAPKPVEAAAPTRTVVTNPVAAPKPAAPTSTTPTVPPQVDIWAVPASVPLGARTTVFWNAKGVASCTVTSPDGSFSQNTLSGGAATVPLSGATTYTISCLTADDKPATDYVTVELSSN